MTRIVYVNGRYQPYDEAQVHVEDRGYQFGDGVYEVVAIHDGNLIDEGPHLDRLDRSLGELRIAAPMARGALRHVLREVVRRNNVRNGIVYLQVTRGVAMREFAFPKESASALTVLARRTKPLSAVVLEQGVKVITHPDIRWKRCDIKSVALLGAVLCKQAAKESGAFEAWLLDDSGMVTEGSSSNAWIVTKDGELITRDPGNAILNGITRLAVIELARSKGLRIVERAFSPDEVKAAKEAFMTSSSMNVVPITQIDDSVIGNGRPGEVSTTLRQLYADYMAA